VTLWFKKGELDAVAAEEAARSGDGAAQDKASQECTTDERGLTGTSRPLRAYSYSGRPWCLTAE
jgi:hypothetical protein